MPDLFCENVDCSPLTLPENLQELVVDVLEEKLDCPSGVWADFNTLHKAWKMYKDAKYVICPNIIPDEPNPLSYSHDLVTETPFIVEIDDCNLYKIIGADAGEVPPAGGIFDANGEISCGADAGL